MRHIYDSIVIGGGIAGLTAAHILKQEGKDLVLLEKQEQPGGNIRTISINGSRMETGPHSFMGSSEYTWKLVDRLNMQEIVEPASPTSKNRYIYRHEKLNPLPMSLGSFLGTSLLSFRSKLRLMLEPFMPNGAKELDTAWEFFCRRFGKEAATYIMTPFISGVYAGDVKMLGARAAFAKFWKFEKDSGSMIWGAVKYMKAKRKRLKKEGVKPKHGLFSFNGGLGTLTTELAEQLADTVTSGIDVERIDKQGDRYIVKANGQQWQARSVIIATPPPATAEMLNVLLPDLVPDFKQIPMSPVAMLHWQVDDPNKSYPDGFGFLMPRKYDLRVLGTLFPSKLFTQRIEDGKQLFVSFYGGMTDKEAMNLDDTQLTELLIKEHKRIFNRGLDGFLLLKIIRYPTAIPQLLPDHPENIGKVCEKLKQALPGVFLAGNYLTGVGIEHAVESGFKASTQCSGFLAQTLTEV